MEEVIIPGKLKGLGSYIKILEAHNIAPIQNPMPILNVALLSRVLQYGLGHVH